MRRSQLWVLTALVWSSHAAAADIAATPSDYTSKLGTLKPGDTLTLAPGTYTDLLAVTGLNGSETQPITITGPASGAPAVFVADPGPCCNTVEISDSSYVVLKNLTIDGNHVDGAFGVSAKSGNVHHITIDGCTFINHDTSQQNVGISTKVATWGWVIRDNRIVGVGTGLYLGNSDGSDPFIGGLIENNLVMDPIGYCMQIKWQQPRPSIAGMPTDPVSTIIRHNVFIKNDAPSPDGDRPNVLVGGFPATGPGSADLYEIYGNFFFHNPRESLFQGSGRVSLHDNVFVDSASAAIRLQNHDAPLQLAHVYDNTIYATKSGIAFGNAAPQGDLVVGNLVLSASPISGPITNQKDNLVDSEANASSYVVSPSTVLGSMDFYPLAGKCQGSAVDLTSVASELDYALDFNGTSKGGFTYRGAYAGEGKNPGWQLAADRKGSAAGSGGGSSVGGGSNVGGGGSSAGGGSSGGASAGGGGASAAGAGAAASGEGEGCGCRAGRSAPPPGAWLWAALGLGFAARALSGRRRACRRP